MGTKTTAELQKAIKDLCGRVGWSQKALARQLHYELYDTDTEREIRQFEERFKKDLSRSTTQPERLERYLDLMREMPEVAKAELIIPQYFSTDELDTEIEEALTAVSKELTDTLRAQEE